MDTAPLKKFAQAARRQLREQVAARLERVLKTDSAELREKDSAIKELRAQLAKSSKEAVIDRVAYTWFNRFCALRFMDVNRYTRVGTISPAEGFTQPEILADAKQGQIDESLATFIDEKKVLDLLGGRATSKDPQQETYRLLIVAVCNYYNSIMPFLFEKIADFTELLMPDDLLSDSSILAATRDTLTADVCKDVEVIGWLYQFYISERKDEVFEDLKGGRKITPENIPAATQLFTPHWIVRYLVENSLGRLWMLNKPTSRLNERMEYYSKSAQEDTDFLRISKPEEIKICDPACGSGHMLTYAFDLLYAIYEEEGYEALEIPSLILENNLFGIEIDERAGELAAFALVMKAREYYRRFFNKPVQPNICILEKIKFDEGELPPYLDAVGRSVFTNTFEKTLHQFQECDNLGSLIRPAATDVATLRGVLQAKNLGNNIFLHKTHDRVLQILNYANFLSQKYHVVVANPPYMGSKSFNGGLQTLSSGQFQNTKSDLFAMFIERNLDLAMPRGMVAMITMQSWMFLSSYENLRSRLLRQETILNMAHLGARAFDSIGGEVVSTTAFILQNSHHPEYKGNYLRLVEGKSEAEKELALRVGIQNPKTGGFYKASAADFKKIPGSPIAYWVSEKIRNIFETESSLGESVEARQGLGTGEDARFFRFFWEINKNDMGLGFESAQSGWHSRKKWFPLNKGGSFRKWYGNREYVISFDQRSRDTLKGLGNHLPSEHKYFQPFITWSDITSAVNSFRTFEQGFLFSNTGHCAFPSNPQQRAILLCYANNKFVNMMTKILNPTIHFHVGYFNLLPYPTALESQIERITHIADRLISIAKTDWDSSETSWDFATLPILRPEHRRLTLMMTYNELQNWCKSITVEMKQLEEENNRLFIEAYDLHDEITADVPLQEISLTCNPNFRYANDKQEEELAKLLLSDSIRDLISYSVGCMFGRYSLQKQGLILANQGDSKEDYLKQIPKPSFPLDDDNVIPMLDGDWFVDDISERFCKFLRLTFGDKHYQENFEFVERALGKDLRKYFLKDFYNDHVKRYKKRPIYWLFSSPKGTFNALIYMHRYRPDTVSVVLNDYLREFRTKLSARLEHLVKVSISTSSSQTEKTKALKEIENLKKTIDELNTYERDVLYPLAMKKIDIDLDDGVKINYAKFGRALKNIPGMDIGED